MRRIFLTLLLIFGAASQSWAALQDRWPLDDTGVTTTVDATTGTDASLAGGHTCDEVTTTGPGGSLAAAFDFDGSADYVDISGASFSAADGAAFSVSFYGKKDGSTSRFIGSGGTSQIIITDTAVNVRTESAGPTAFTVPSLSTTLWHHYLIVRVATTNVVHVYADGTESSSGGQAVSGIFSPSRFGYASGSTLDGKGAGLRLYDSDESANVAALVAEGVDSGPDAAIIYYYQQQQQ